MSIEHIIDQAIDSVRYWFDKIPGVAILHYLHSGEVVHMNKEGLRLLDIGLQELRSMGTAYHAKFFNPEEAKEYVPKILALLERNNNDEYVTHFQQVRTNRSNDWELWLSSTKIFQRDEHGKPLLIITLTSPIEAEHNFHTKVERLLEENSFLRKNHHLYASLTGREKEILKLTAMDIPSIAIAEQLNLSQDTVKTHRRNIKKKLRAENHYDIMRFAQAFDII